MKKRLEYDQTWAKSKIYSKMLSIESYSRYKYVDPTKNCIVKRLIIK